MFTSKSSKKKKGNRRNNRNYKLKVSATKLLLHQISQKIVQFNTAFRMCEEISCQREWFELDWITVTF